jgi:hypothetical protein
MRRVSNSHYLGWGERARTKICKATHYDSHDISPSSSGPVADTAGVDSLRGVRKVRHGHHLVPCRRHRHHDRPTDLYHPEQVSDAQDRCLTAVLSETRDRLGGCPAHVFEG